MYVIGIGTKNYSSVEDTIRRKSRDRLWTGQQNLSQIMSYSRWQNMSQLYNCPSPAANNVTGLIPVCDKFQHDWNQTEANEHGYYLLWNSTEANTV